MDVARRGPGVGVAVLCGVAALGVVSCRDAGERDEQSESIAESRRIDLPAIEAANRVVIETRDGPRAELTSEKDLARLRALLRPRKVPPSGGESIATISFFKGETLIRKVWLYGDGEWGFERQGRTSWTTGLEPGLADFVRKALADSGKAR